MRTAIDVVFFDAGGGHRSAAMALEQVCRQQGRDWDVRLVNLQHILAPLDVFRKLTGIASEDVYNLFLKRGWTLGSPQILRAMHLLIRAYHPAQVRLLREHWQRSQPDLVVSVIPNFNRALFQSLSGTSLITILTDFADYPPHFWMENQPQYFICGTGKAVGQALAMGHPADRVFRTSGMILNPRFYEPVAQHSADPALPTGIVLFGGQGSKAMLGIARRLGESGLPIQLIMMCGHNQILADKIRALKTAMPIRVEGFTRDVPRFMSMADFFIGKPGPGSISEAIAMKLPVIVERNSWTMVQERYNADWVTEMGVGLVVQSLDRIVDAVTQLLEPSAMHRFRTALDQLDNRAVFEIPEILDRILAKAATPLS